MFSSDSIDNKNNYINMWDVPVIVLVICSIAWPVYLVLTDKHESMTVLIKIIDISIGIIGNLYLLIWLTRGRGVSSTLWNWLPPFWPIGKIFDNSKARVIIVLLLVCVAIFGFLSEVGVLNIPSQF